MKVFSLLVANDTGGSGRSIGTNQPSPADPSSLRYISMVLQQLTNGQ